MKRILVLLTVVALMMVMLAMSVVPAFATPPRETRGTCMLHYLKDVGVSGHNAALFCTEP